MFGLIPTGADPEIYAPSGDVIEGHRLFCKQNGMAISIPSNEHRYAHTLRLGRKRRKQCPGFRKRLVERFALTRRRHEVIGHPSAIETKFFDELPAAKRRVPTARRQKDAYAE